MNPFLSTRIVDFSLTLDKPLAVEVNSYTGPPVSPSQYSADMHYALHLGIVLEGGIHVVYPDHERDVPRGGVWLTSIWEPHCGHAETGTRILLCTVLPERVGEIGLPTGTDWLSPFMLPPGDRPHLKRSEDFLQIARHLQESHHDPVQAWLSFHHLLHQVVGETAAGGADLRANYPRLRPAIQLVRQHHQHAIRVEEAAAACGLGRSRFSQLFRQTLGVSFGEFALRARVAGALADLQTNRYSTADIAARWGFYDASHLRRTLASHLPDQAMPSASVHPSIPGSAELHSA